MAVCAQVWLNKQMLKKRKVIFFICINLRFVICGLAFFMEIFVIMRLSFVTLTKEGAKSVTISDARAVCNLNYPIDQMPARAALSFVSMTKNDH